MLAPGGVIVLDDMLHPGYPTLMVAVHEYLQRHPEMCVLCIIDRETIVAATKFVLCRTEWFKRYEERLLEAYKDNVWPLGADFEPHWCLVLSLDTTLAAIDIVAVRMQLRRRPNWRGQAGRAGAGSASRLGADIIFSERFATRRSGRADGERAEAEFGRAGRRLIGVVVSADRSAGSGAVALD